MKRIPLAIALTLTAACATAEPPAGWPAAPHGADDTLGADGWGLEVIAFENPARPFEVHQTLLAKHGVYILENMATADLATDGPGAFFFVLGVPRLEGMVQAIINPVAMR